MSHIILVNPKLGQVETHEVDSDTFLKVWDIVHSLKQESINKSLSFGERERTQAINDAMNNSSFEEPEIEEVKECEVIRELPELIPEENEAPKYEFKPQPKPAPKTNNADSFAESLAALMASNHNQPEKNVL